MPNLNLTLQELRYLKMLVREDGQRALSLQKIAPKGKRWKIELDRALHILDKLDEQDPQ